MTQNLLPTGHHADENSRRVLAGSHAVLGMDLVAFSTFHVDDQIRAIQTLTRWIKEALGYHSIGDRDYRWSPAGDGGFVTFATNTACVKAVDSAFAILDKVAQPDWRPRTGERIQLRMGLHAGMILEDQDLGRDTNIWGLGINIASRILSLARPGQLLVSKEYFDTYIKGQREERFDIGELHRRTVKHGVTVEVMNVSCSQLGISLSDAADGQWQVIGETWETAKERYNFFIKDAMCSDDPVAALAAAKYLLDLQSIDSDSAEVNHRDCENDARDPVWEFCCVLGQTAEKPQNVGYPVRYHPLFSHMPPDILLKVLRAMKPRIVSRGEVICPKGERSRSLFFPVAGKVVVSVFGVSEPIEIDRGDIIGEFSLWIRNIKRTATVRSATNAHLLEIDNSDFRRILCATGDFDDAESGDVEAIISALIRRRILENALSSELLFPEVASGLKEELSTLGAFCEKYDAGRPHRLDLSGSTYLLFNGRVQIHPQGFEPLTIDAEGRFIPEAVVGIISELGEPDGQEAVVDGETVAVRIPKEVLRDLQNRFPRMRSVWNGIWGQRRGQLRRSSENKTNGPKPRPAESTPSHIWNIDEDQNRC